MLDDKKRAEFEQQSMLFGEVVPGVYRSMYQGLIVQGFSQEQAMSLLQTYIVKDCARGFHLPKIEPPSKPPDDSTD